MKDSVHVQCTAIITFRSNSCILQAFKSFSVQYEMKKKQTVPLLQPVHREGKLSVDQALVKQAWDRVSARVSVLHSSSQHEYGTTKPQESRIK